jgi:GMP synthase (glutamine-hydrolysing)
MSIRILLVDCGSRKVPEIGYMLNDLSIAYDIVKLNDISKVDSVYKGIIVSGAPILLTETNPAPYLEKFDILVKSNLPLLGICFGHQLLGLYFGCEISKCKEDRDIQTIHLKGQHILFDGFGIWETFMEDHCECISLPENFELLGYSVVSPNEAMHHTTKPLFGVQFHPEVSGENGKKLFANFIKICKG